MKIETQTIKCRVIRKTSPYNKYIKWFTECYYEDGKLLSSFGYRTRKEAEAELKDSNVPFPIGNRLTQTHYQRID